MLLGCTDGCNDEKVVGFPVCTGFNVGGIVGSIFESLGDLVILFPSGGLIIGFKDGIIVGSASFIIIGAFVVLVGALVTLVGAFVILVGAFGVLSFAGCFAGLFFDGFDGLTFGFLPGGLLTPPPGGFLPPPFFAWFFRSFHCDYIY